MGNAAWAELADDPESLGQLDPDVVLFEVLRGGLSLDRLPAEIVAVLAVGPVADPDDRRFLRAFAQVRHSDVPLRQDDGDAGPAWGGWPVAWAGLRRDPVSIVLARHPGGVNAVAAVSLSDGRTLLATGGEDRSVWLWDPADGGPSTGRRIRQRGAVNALAAVPLPDGTTRLAVASGRSVRLYDPRTGDLAGEQFTGFPATVSSVVAICVPEGRTLLAVGTESPDAFIRLYDVASGAPVGRPLGSRTTVKSLDVVPGPDGQPWLVSTESGYLPGTRFWNLTTMEKDFHADGPSLAVPVPMPDGRTLLATRGTEFRPIGLYDPVTTEQVGDTMEHTGTVMALAPVPLPDGRTLLAAGYGPDLIQLWDTGTCAPVGPPLTAHFGAVFALTALASPGGRTLLVSGGIDGTVRLWDPVAIGEEDPHPPAWEPPELTAVPLPDGRPGFAGVADGLLSRWDAATGETVGEPVEVGEDELRVLTAAAMPDGRTVVATGTDLCTARFWDLDAGRLLGATAPPMDVNVLAAVPRAAGGACLAAAAFHLALWDPDTGAPTRGRPVGPVEEVLAMTALALPDDEWVLVTGSGKPVVGSGKGELRFWDPHTGDQLGDALPAHQGKVNTVVAVPLLDGRTLVASGGDDGLVRLWDPVRRATVTEPFRPGGGRVLALAAVPMPDGGTLLAAGTEGRTVRLWSPLDGTRVGRPLSGHTARVRALAVAPLPDGGIRLASGSADGTIRLWDPVTGQAVGDALTGHTARVRALAVAPLPDGDVRLASGSADGTIRLWDPATGQTVGDALTGHSGEVATLAALPLADGRTVLASGNTDGIRLWDPKGDGGALGRLTGHDVTDAVPVRLPDERVVIATGAMMRGGQAQVRFWDPGTGAEVGDALDGHTAPLATMPAPDGRTMLVTSDRGDWAVLVVDPETRATIGERLAGHDSWVFDLATVPMPDGRHLIATASEDHSVRLWDPIAGAPVGPPLTGHTQGVATVAAVPLPDGRTGVLSGSWDGTIRLWDPERGECVRTLDLGSPVTELTMSGPYLAVRLDAGQLGFVTAPR